MGTFLVITGKIHADGSVLCPDERSSPRLALYRRRGRMQGERQWAAVEKSEDKRKPERFFGHRNPARSDNPEEASTVIGAFLFCINFCKLFYSTSELAADVQRGDALAGFTVSVLSDCVTSYDKKKLPEMLAYYESKGCSLFKVAELSGSI